MDRLSALVALLLVVVVAVSSQQQELTWYQYYTDGGRTSGLTADEVDFFRLNGRPMRIVSGAVHYFRVHPVYWPDRLAKVRAAGCNAVETYVPWNLHEARRGVFDFGDGGGDMSPLLDLRRFVELARQADLFVILRPGPYICAEWEFGGLPSWLLRDPNMKLRTSYEPYLEVADRYLSRVIDQVRDLQFTLGDGPIIAFQVENEYGAFGVGDNPRDTEYLIHLRDEMIRLGVVELFFTSDTPSNSGQLGAIPGVLQTANLQNDPEKEFALLDEFQPNRPNMVAEFWTGWFDHWMAPYHVVRSVEQFNGTLDRILAMNGSVNLFMFHGGTSFGFLNGANVLPVFPNYAATISSYDYDAPVSEAGDYTAKYWALRGLLAAYQRDLPVATPPSPPPTQRVAYDTVALDQHLTLDDLADRLGYSIRSDDVLAMEDLPINEGNGQSYGFILYRHEAVLSRGRHSIKTSGHVRDMAVLVVDGERVTDRFHSLTQLVDFGYWPLADRSTDFNVSTTEVHRVDLLVENTGRNNYGPPSYFDQKKGLVDGPVLVDGEPLTGWQIFPLEFTGDWVRSLSGWKRGRPAVETPAAYLATLRVDGEPSDTFILTGDWGKGNVFVNGFNVGRFFSFGPTRSLFVPAPLLHQGDNTIVVFDVYQRVTEVVFSTEPDMGPVLDDLLPTTPAP